MRYHRQDPHPNSFGPLDVVNISDSQTLHWLSLLSEADGDSQNQRLQVMLPVLHDYLQSA
jgi:hypothetical protein